jgi:hypothetical protein
MKHFEKEFHRLVSYHLKSVDGRWKPKINDKNSTTSIRESKAKGRQVFVARRDKSSLEYWHDGVL